MIEKLKMLVEAEKLLENLYNNSDLNYSLIEDLNSGDFKDGLSTASDLLNEIEW